MHNFHRQFVCFFRIVVPPFIDRNNGQHWNSTNKKSMTAPVKTFTAFYQSGSTICEIERDSLALVDRRFANIPLKTIRQSFSIKKNLNWIRSIRCAKYEKRLELIICQELFSKVVRVWGSAVLWKLKWTGYKLRISQSINHAKEQIFSSSSSSPTLYTITLSAFTAQCMTIAHIVHRNKFLAEKMCWRKSVMGYSISCMAKCVAKNKCVCCTRRQ